MFGWKRKTIADVEAEITECNVNIDRCDKEIQHNINDYGNLVSDLKMNKGLQKEMNWWCERRHSLKEKLSKMQNKFPK